MVCTKLIGLKKELNKKLFAEADILVDKDLSLCIKLAKSRKFEVYYAETGVLLSDVAQQQRRKNADVTKLYFVFLDAAGIFSTLVLNQNTKPKEGEREEAVSLSK